MKWTKKNPKLKLKNRKGKGVEVWEAKEGPYPPSKVIRTGKGKWLEETDDGSFQPVTMPGLLEKARQSKKKEVNVKKFIENRKK